MKDWAELIQAVASLLWPLFAFVALYIFKGELGQLFRRLKKGKLFGQEIELEDSLNKLAESANLVTQESAAALTHAPAKPPQEVVDDEVQEILKETARSPKAALMQLGALLERKVRRYLAASGQSNLGPYQSLQHSIGRIASSLPGHIPSTLDLFAQVRNEIVHGKEASDSDVLRAIDSGVMVLKAIEALPVETNFVEHIDVPIFLDAACTQPFPYGKAVILRTISPGGAQTFYRIFPTTQTHFRVGMQVAWEWSMANVWNDAWYRVPESGEIAQAWNSSAEFTGRDLDSI